MSCDVDSGQSDLQNATIRAILKDDLASFWYWPLHQLNLCSCTQKLLLFWRSKSTKPYSTRLKGINQPAEPIISQADSCDQWSTTPQQGLRRPLRQHHQPPASAWLQPGLRCYSPSSAPSCHAPTLQADDATMQASHAWSHVARVTDQQLSAHTAAQAAGRPPTGPLLHAPPPSNTNTAASNSCKDRVHAVRTAAGAASHSKHAACCALPPTGGRTFTLSRHAPAAGPAQAQGLERHAMSNTLTATLYPTAQPLGGGSSNTIGTAAHSNKKFMVHRRNGPRAQQPC